MNNLQSFRDAILQLIETYDLTFGEVCGTFEDIKFDLLSCIYFPEEEDDT